jgi:hypothetical protein
MTVGLDGTVFKTLYKTVSENEIEKVRKKDTFPITASP